MEASRFKFVPEALVLNVPEMDSEHEAIFQLLAHLKSSSLGAMPFRPELVEEILTRLRAHFATEERLAKDAGEDFSEHAQKHEALLQRVAELMNLTLRGNGNVYSLLCYVEYWCERHINDEDKRFAVRLLVRMPAD